MVTLAMVLKQYWEYVAIQEMGPMSFCAISITDTFVYYLKLTQCSQHATLKSALLMATLPSTVISLPLCSLRQIFTTEVSQFIFQTKWQGPPRATTSSFRIRSHHSRDIILPEQMCFRNF